MDNSFICWCFKDICVSEEALVKHKSFSRIEILAANFSPSDEGLALQRERRVWGKVLLELLLPSCFKVFSLRKTAHLKTQPCSRPGQLVSFLHSVTMSVLLSGISASLILSLVLNPPQSVHFYKGQEGKLHWHLPLKSSVVKPTVLEKRRQEWQRLGSENDSPKPWLVSLFFSRDRVCSVTTDFVQGQIQVLFQRTHVKISIPTLIFIIKNNITIVEKNFLYSQKEKVSLRKINIYFQVKSMLFKCNMIVQKQNISNIDSFVCWCRTMHNRQMKFLENFRNFSESQKF